MFIGLMASQTARKLFIPLLPLPLLPPPPLPLPLHTPHQLRHQHHHPSRPPHPQGSLGRQPFCLVAHRTTWADEPWVAWSSPRICLSTYLRASRHGQPPSHPHTASFCHHRSCVGTSLVLGEHADLGRVLASEGLRVKTLLDGFVSKLDLLTLFQLLQLIVLGKLTLLIVVFVCF